MKTLEEIELYFTHYAMREDDLIAFIELKDRCVRLASAIDSHCPACSERKQALIRLEECSYWAKAAIARASRSSK